MKMYLALFILHAIVHAQESTSSLPQLVVFSFSTGVSGGRSWNRERKGSRECGY